ncbi:MAG: UPF0175 family protein [Verrucomicrobia bacterium]|nr:UPF0175 family protein [Verrucomicrobiota bacterium]
MTLTLDISDKALAAARLACGDVRYEAKKELALAFYARGFLSLGKAVELAETTRRDFESWLAERKIERPFSEEELAREFASAE